jgi:hypothetical protein
MTMTMTMTMTSTFSLNGYRYPVKYANRLDSCQLCLCYTMNTCDVRKVNKQDWLASIIHDTGVHFFTSRPKILLAESAKASWWPFSKLCRELYPLVVFVQILLLHVLQNGFKKVLLSGARSAFMKASVSQSSMWGKTSSTTASLSRAVAGRP